MFTFHSKETFFKRHVSIEKFIFVLKKSKLRGAFIIKKRENFGLWPKKAWPPPLSDILDFFEFQTYLKNADPPSRINFRHF